MKGRVFIWVDEATKVKKSVWEKLQKMKFKRTNPKTKGTK